MKTRFIIIRHGESEGNLSNSFAGRIDVKLTPLGLKQGECTGEFLKNEKIDAFYSSSLSRAYITTKLAADHHNMPVTPRDDLMEINGGRWESLTYSSIKEQFPENYNNWITDIGNVHCEGGESVKEVRDRVYSAFEEIAKMHPDQTVCVGSHGMAIRAFVLKVLGLSLDEMHSGLPWVSNASVTYVDYEEGVFTLIEYGYDLHLEQAGIKTVLRAKA